MTPILFLLILEEIRRRLKVKKAIFLGGLFLFAVHFLLSLAYLAPVNWIPPKLRSAANLYIIPVFHQNWQVFAPEPPISANRFLFRCHFNNGEVSKWINPGEPLLRKHQSNRFWNYGKQFNIYESIGDNLVVSYRRINGSTAPVANGFWEAYEYSIMRTPSYQMACKYSLQKAEQVFQDKVIEGVEFVAETFYVRPYESRFDTNMTLEKETMRFPRWEIDQGGGE